MVNTKPELQRLSKSTPSAAIGGAFRASGELIAAISDVLTRTIDLILRTAAAAIEDALPTRIRHIRATFQSRQDTETPNNQKPHVFEQSSLAADTEISNRETRELDSDLPQKNNAEPPRLDALREELTIAEEALHGEQEDSINREDIEMKLRLARAYVELGDTYLARAMLDEVRDNDHLETKALVKNANKATVDSL